MPGDLGLTHGIRRAVQVRGGGTAVIDGPTELSWCEFADRVARTARVFDAHGLGSGDRVAILSLNSHRYLECIYAALHAGGVAVPLNHRLNEAELAAQVGDCAPSIVVLGDGFTHLAEPLREASRRSVKTVLHAAATGPGGPLPIIEDLLREAAPLADAGRTGDDLACIFYTGGTTSAAKGVMLSHANLLANAANTVAMLRLDETSVHMHHGPLFHVAAGARLFSVTQVAATHVFSARFEAKESLAEFTRARVTHATFVPTMLRMLLEHPFLVQADLSTLQTISYGAAPMPEPLLRELAERLPHIRYVQSYGMTEASPVVTMLGPCDHERARWPTGRLRSAGKAAMFCELAIVDASGRPVATGNHGEIVARGPNIMLGYWNRPELTAEALRDGWLHTGDVGYLDDDGYLFVVDRIKDMIISGGENVYSQEVESALASHPLVSQCAVFGIPDERWGEAVHASVVLKGGTELSEAELVAHCRALIAPYKCPRSVDFRCEPLPLSGAGKILKTQLREEVARSRETSRTNPSRTASAVPG